MTVTGIRSGEDTHTQTWEEGRPADPKGRSWSDADAGPGTNSEDPQPPEARRGPGADRALGSGGDRAAGTLAPDSCPLNLGEHVSVVLCDNLYGSHRAPEQLLIFSSHRTTHV